MRATTLVNRVLDLDGVTVTSVAIEPDVLRIGVRLSRRRLICPIETCDFSTRWRAEPVRWTPGGGRWTWAVTR